MKLEPYTWKAPGQLSEDYVHRFDAVRELYDYSPWGESGLEARTAWLDGFARPDGHRERLADALAAYNRKSGAPEPVFENISRLRDPRALVVIGGQQAGVFTGPLLVIYKAVTILQEAAAAEARLHRPVIPVFWIAGEDHDWDEVNHLHWLSPKPEIEKLKIDPPSDVRTSVSRMQIAGWEEALQQLGESLMQTEFKAGLLDTLKAFAGQSRTLTDMCAKIMSWLFGSRGLVLLDSDDPGLRRLEAPMFARLLANQSQLAGALLAGKRKVEALGFTAQAEVSEENANLFLFDERGERTLLVKTADGFTDKKREREYTRSQLERWIEDAPERFSNNVMSRPLMQEYLFPVLTTVLGDGEIAYWSLLREAFRAMDMRMPLLLPRRQYTIIENTVNKHMEKFALTFGDVIERFDERRSEWLREQDTLGLEQRFAQVKDGFRELYDPLLEVTGTINPGISKLGAVNLTKIIEQIDFLEARATEANQAQFEAGLRQLERIRLSLHPLDKPQERVFNIFAYLNKYGRQWLDELLDTPQEPREVHRLLYL